ncbi:MAG: outer membrane protein assembly factor BamB family protein [Planctomycetota bacterium]|jgi:outer membrane protein assembly factor BamB
MTANQDRSVDDILFVAFSKNVAALDRYSGEILWQWKIPKGGSYVTLLLDGDRLVVGAYGYIYCLDPLFGQLVWENPMKGLGVGVTSLASTRGAADVSTQQARAAEAARQAAASGGATTPA